MLTVKGQWVVGFNGVTDFEVGVLSGDDTVTAMEQALIAEGEDVTMLRVRKYEMAQTLRVAGERLTPEQIGALWHADYDAVNQAMMVAEKKLLASLATSLAPKTTNEEPTQEPLTS